MFLTKKAEDAFNALLKQAKDILDGDKDEKEVTEVKETDLSDLNTDGMSDEEAFNVVIKAYQDGFYFPAIKEYMKWEKPKRNLFKEFPAFASMEPVELHDLFEKGIKDAEDEETRKELEKAKAQKQNASKEEKKETDEVAETKSVEKTEEDPLDDLFGDEKSAEPTDADVAGLEGADLNDVPNSSDESKKNASIFDFLHKKAEDVTVEAEIADEYPLDEQVKKSVRFNMEEGKTKQDAIASALEECHCVDNEHYKQVAEDAANTFSNLQPKTLDVYNASVKDFLEKAADYKEEGNEFDHICELSKSCSTAYEFLNKVANKLDENTAKQYPGQKLFDDPKNVSFDGGFGTSPQHPGQKVLSTKKGGNDTVETVFPKAEKPQVDVYIDKVNRQKVTTINSKDGTIAFMQPVPFEQQKMGEPADYTGFVTGTKLEQFGKPNADGPVAGAAHKTEKYLDKVYEVADKKDVVGKPHAAKAEFTYGMRKEAADPKFAKLHELIAKYKTDNGLELSQLDGNQVLTGDPEAIKNLEQEVLAMGYNCKIENMETGVEDEVPVHSLTIFVDDAGNHKPMAGFNFYGLEKSASKKKILKSDLTITAGQSDIYVGGPTCNEHGQSDMSNDSVLDTISTDSKKHSLTDKEVKEAQERIENKESQIQRANGFLFHINKVAFDNLNEVEEISDSVDELQQASPIGHQEVVDSAKNADFKTFETQLGRQLMLNKQPNETIEEVKVDQGPVEEYQKQLNPEVANTPNNSDDKSDKKEKSDKDSKKDTETEKDSSSEDNPLDGLEDLLK